MTPLHDPITDYLAHSAATFYCIGIYTDDDDNNDDNNDDEDDDDD